MHFGTVSDVVEFMKDLDPSRQWVFRGERSHFPTMPTAARRYEDATDTLPGPYVGGFASRIPDVLPGWSERHWRQQLIGVEMLGGYPDDVVDLFSIWLLEGLLQHYGWPTDFLDLTLNPAVAIFFACYDFAKGGFDETGTGRVYVWDLATLRSDPTFLYHGALLDLRWGGNRLAELVGVKANRPEAQAALGLKMTRGWRQEELLPNLADEVITFGRHDAPLACLPREVLFPPDGLRDFLLAADTSNRNFLRLYASSNPAELEAIEQILEVGSALRRRIDGCSAGV